MRCYICRVRSDHLLRLRRDINYIGTPTVLLCWKCLRAKLRRTK